MTEMRIFDSNLVNGRLTEYLLNRISSENITSLDLSDCLSLTSLPENLPSGLTSLDLTRCYNLKSLPDKLPSGLASLYLTRCQNLTSLPENLPSGLTSLNLSDCSSLASLPENLPSGITSLNLSDCSSLASLPENLPSGITSLNLSHCQNLTSLPENLPSGITSLNLSHCQNLTSLPENLPSGITSLYLSDCSSLRSLPENLPSGLTYLDLTRCQNLTSLPENLPSGITSLYLSDCSSLTSLPENLPSGLTYLDLTRCQNLRSLPDKLPSGLASLYLTRCQNLTSLPENLPSGLASLDLSDCQNLTSLPENLPSGITSLNLSRCQNLRSLPENLPSGITSLNLSYCLNLTSLPDKLPSGITSLNLTECRSLTSLPENLPSGITSLNLSRCQNLTSLPENLPSGITYLDLTRCQNLTSLPENLPSGITYLYLSDCSSLTSLPENLPSGLTYLDLTECNNLQFTEDLINRLEVLETNDCEIRYPDHYLAQNDQAARAVAKLDRTIEVYKESHADEPKPSLIKTLFNRYLTEGVGQRGSSQATNSKKSLKEIVATTAPILDLFAKNSNHLKWAEEIAKNYLNGCVNQPVAGWLEISAWASIAEAPTVEEKLEASNHLRAIESITSYVADLPDSQKPGVGVEVEFFNALFREVHKKLLDNGNISKPWLGVPKGVAYERMVAEKITPDVIESAYEGVQNVLSQSQKDVAKYFCEDLHQSTWAEIVCGATRIEAINKIFEEKLELIENLIQNPESAKAHAFRKANPIAGESFPTLEQIQGNIANERNEAILTKSKELTFAALEQGEEEFKSDLDSNERKSEEEKDKEGHEASWLGNRQEILIDSNNNPNQDSELSNRVSETEVVKEEEAEVELKEKEKLSDLIPVKKSSLYQRLWSCFASSREEGRSPNSSPKTESSKTLREMIFGKSSQQIHAERDSR
jgi:hypothetical protein